VTVLAMLSMCFAMGLVVGASAQADGQSYTVVTEELESIDDNVVADIKSNMSGIEQTITLSYTKPIAWTATETVERGAAFGYQYPGIAVPVARGIPWVVLAGLAYHSYGLIQRVRQ